MDSLFDGDVSQCRVADTYISGASVADVEELCRQWHYSRRGGAATWRWGLWWKHMLLGVVAYNLPTLQTCQSVFGPEYANRVWHMGRLAFLDEAPRNSESRLIAGSLREIKRTHPHVWAVVTYADISEGHTGYVYQATNAIYTGTSKPGQKLVNPDSGETFSGRSLNAWSRADQYGDTITHRERARLRGLDMTYEAKHRYVYILGDRRELRERKGLLRLPKLSYPKG